jgi:hypothetical protein
MARSWWVILCFESEASLFVGDGGRWGIGKAAGGCVYTVEPYEHSITTLHILVTVAHA